MTDAPKWQRYLRIWRPDVAADIDDELQFHIDMRAREYEARGMTPARARYAALARFGDLGAITTALRAHDRRLERAHRQREIMSDLLQDLRIAWRGLRRSPGFTTVVVLTLALGIGANTAIFSVVDAVLLRALPYDRPEQLVGVTGNTQAEFLGIREQSRSFREVAAYGEQSVSVSGRGVPLRLDGAVISANLFATLGVRPALGRAFLPGEDASGNARQVILGYGLWQRRYGGDPGIVGHTVILDGLPHTVVGVMPADVRFPSPATQLWIPMEISRGNPGAFWGNGGYRLVARLAPGVSLRDARTDVRAVARELRHENPVWDPGPTYGADWEVVSLQQRLVGGMRTPLVLLLAVVGFVLLIACANVASLVLVRAVARQKELAVRAALGGGRGRLVQHLLTESLLLAALGATAGLLLAWLGMRSLRSLLPVDLPRADEIAIDGHVLAFTAGLALATGVAFGLAPALRATAALRSGLDESGRSVSRGIEHQRLSAALVAVEIALAVVLVTAASLLVRSFWTLRHIDPGFRTERVIAARVSPPEAHYADSSRVRILYTQLLDRVAALPGVERVAAVDHLPLGSPVYGMAIRVEGQFEDVHHSLPGIDHYQVVTPGYFRTMGIPLRRGRLFTDADRAGAPDVVLVSESLARHFWPGQDPTAKRIGYPWESPWLTVIGVVADVKQDSLSGTGEMSIYRPFLQAPATSMTLVISTAADPAVLAARLRTVVAEVDRDVPVSDIRTMRQVLATSVARPRFTMLLVAAFAAVALLLGAVGIYGVMSYTVRRRTREIGVRMALGAAPRDAVRLVLHRSAIITAAGVGTGLAGALALTRVLASLLYGVTTTDPLTFIMAPAILAAVAFLASYLPARRASRVDPTVALRTE